MLLKIKTALCLAFAALLPFAGAACALAQKEPAFYELYLSDPVGNVERFGTLIPENSKIGDIEKTVKLGSATYLLTHVSVEQICSSSGEVLANSDKYYKAAAKDGSSPKLTAVYDRDGGFMTSLAVDGFALSAISSENDLKELFENILANSCGYAPKSATAIVSYIENSPENGWRDGASAYIVTFSDSYAGFSCAAGYLLLRDNTLQFSFYKSDPGRCGEFLESIDEEAVKESAEAYINSRLGEGAQKGTVDISEGSITFRSVGGRGCFLFDGSFTSGQNEQTFSAIYFVE